MGARSASRAASTCSSRCTARPTSTTRRGSAASSTRSSSSAARFPVVFPIHPRTRARLGDDGALGAPRGRRRALHRAGRLPRLPLAAGRRRRGRDRLRRRAGGDVGARRPAATRSGPNTERPITLTHGTNVLLGDDPPTLAQVELADVGRRRRRRSRCGTATPASASPTCSSPTTRSPRAFAGGAPMPERPADARLLVRRAPAADARAARRLGRRRARLGHVRQGRRALAAARGARALRVRPDEPQHPEPAAQRPARVRASCARERPRALLTTGAGVAVPFAWIGRAAAHPGRSTSRASRASRGCRSAGA